jgi:hypothetical protein
MKYSVSPPTFGSLNMSSPLIRRGCRLLVHSSARILHFNALFSRACSLFSQNTREGGTPFARLSASLFKISSVSPLSVVFTPNSPLSSLSTVFTHCNRGVWSSEPKRHGASEEKGRFLTSPNWRGIGMTEDGTVEKPCPKRRARLKPAAFSLATSLNDATVPVT